MCIIFTLKSRSYIYLLLLYRGTAFEVTEAEGVSPGTKIVISLKPDCRKFAEENTVKEIIKKHSSFVGFPVKLNGKKLNTVQVSIAYLNCAAFNIQRIFVN